MVQVRYILRGVGLLSDLKETQRMPSFAAEFSRATGMRLCSFQLMLSVAYASAILQFALVMTQDLLLLDLATVTLTVPLPYHVLFCPDHEASGLIQNVGTSKTSPLTNVT